jgi:AcrR family transcriptional regulator
MSPASERSSGSRAETKSALPKAETKADSKLELEAKTESKGEATRARIVQRALELAAGAGLDGLSIGNLARDLGLSKSGLFAHFGSKEQLQLDVIDTAAELFRSAVFDPALRAALGEARVLTLFENYLKWIQSREVPGGCVFSAGAFEWDDARGPVRQRIVEWFEKLNGSLVRVVAGAVERGEFRADLDVDLFANELHGILLKYHLEVRLLRNKKAATFARRAYRHRGSSGATPLHPDQTVTGARGPRGNHHVKHSHIQKKHDRSCSGHGAARQPLALSALPPARRVVVDRARHGAALAAARAPAAARRRTGRAPRRPAASAHS